MLERCNQWKNLESTEKRAEKSVQIEKIEKYSVEELKKSLIVAQTGKDKSFQKNLEAKNVYDFWDDKCNK